MKSKMEPKILTMGRNKDYCEIEIDESRLKKEISKMIGKSEGELLDSLRIEGAEIVAGQLKNYGGTVSLTEETTTSESVIDGLERFFRKVNQYAEKHNANYALVQDLELRERTHLTYSVNGLIQLLTE